MASILRKGRPSKVRLFAGAVLAARFSTTDAATIIGAPEVPLSPSYRQGLRRRLLAHAKGGGQIFNVAIHCCSRQSLLSNLSGDVLAERVDDLVDSVAFAARNVPEAYELCRSGSMQELIEKLDAPMPRPGGYLTSLLYWLLVACKLASASAIDSCDRVPFTSGTCAGLARIFGDLPPELERLG